jgi:hypothetical protein
VTGEKTQTVNVCDNTNTEGSYARKFRILDRKYFVTDEFIKTQDSIQDLVDTLKQRSAIEETCESDSASGTTVSKEPLFAVDENWVASIIPDVEASINNLINEFIRNPYLHRVEHSLHCQLYCHLTGSKELGKIEDYREVSPRRVQKEWPETTPRRGHDRRGNFDLAILGPAAQFHHQSVSPDNFQLGLIKPGVVIEIGLDYDLDHLEQDEIKLRNSDVRHGYLVHFVRPTGEPQNPDELEQVINRLIKAESEGIHIAYAQVDEDRKQIRYRKLGESSITAIPTTGMNG